MSCRALAVIVAIAVGLTVLFWGPLWDGHGLIGGDLYSYFFPQKVFYANQLAQGRLPLWNDLVGFGYPILAESQTGVFYPSNPLLYCWFDVNTAYNISQLGHYGLAFVFTWLLMRRLDLSATAATLASIVFVYGWFPPRICLEWAIIGGVYFPLALWCVESHLQTARRRWLILLAASQGVHLLAGHFNLAFITQLTCVAYAGLRLLAVADSKPYSETIDGRRFSTIVLIVIAIVGGFGLAAVQVLPTWELKQLSQREDIGAAHDPGYGHIPPWYLSQVVAPWLWYGDDADPDQALQSIRAFSIASGTNKVEAHLYFGMLPLLLISYRLFAALGGAALDRRHRHWLWLGGAAMIYTTGWLLPVTRHLPGFSFFMGPGRYGIVTTLAAAIMAGAGFDRLLSWRRLPSRSLIIGIVIGLTVADLFWVSRQVTYAVMVDDPPINHIEESAVRDVLRNFEARHGLERRVRMLAPGANLATLTGFAAYPAYLGLGPAAYYDPAQMMPEPTDEMPPTERATAVAARKEWLAEVSITHVLAMEPLNLDEWPESELVWQGGDRLLNTAWGSREPLFLYELRQSLPRVRINAADPESSDELVVERYQPEELEFTASTQREAMEVTIADLAYPGWETLLDGWIATVRVDAEHSFPMVEVPRGDHLITRRYAPRSVAFAGLVSGVAWVGLFLLTTVIWWRRRGDVNSGNDLPEVRH